MKTERNALIVLLASIAATMQAWGWKGVCMFGLLLAFLAFLIAWGDLNPVQQAADHVVAPVGRSVGILASRCPGGWDDLSERGIDTPVFVCAKGNWRVILKPDGKTFSHAVQLDTPGAVIIEDSTKVPGW